MLVIRITNCGFILPSANGNKNQNHVPNGEVIVISDDEDDENNNMVDKKALDRYVYELMIEITAEL